MNFLKSSSRGLNYPPDRLLPCKTIIMFGLFKKDPIKKLEKEHAKLLEEAMSIQRSGDIKGYAAKMAEAEELEKKIAEMREEKK